MFFCSSIKSFSNELYLKYIGATKYFANQNYLNLKIVFICGSLEIGNDGVGDYTRRFTTELVRQGHQVGIIAISDKYVITKFEGNQKSERVDTPVLRLPSHFSASDRFVRAKEWMDDFDPEWLSLQYGPFAFHYKGLPFNLGKHFHKFGVGKKWHIMFHELWLGMDKESAFKYKLWGSLQKNIIKSLLHRLKPLLITTNTHIYQYQLTRLGFKTNFLPLFSNIPFRHSDNLKRVFNDIKTLRFVIFGNIHFGAPIQEFAKQAAAYSKNNKVIRLIFIGHCGIEKQTWINAWEANNLPYKDYGMQIEQKISWVLSNADFGITTTPYWLTEKSGAVAAMRDHGLPVICVSREWHPAGKLNLIQPAGVFLFSEINFEDLMHIKKITQTQSDLTFTTNRLLLLLSQLQPQ